MGQGKYKENNGYLETIDTQLPQLNLLKAFAQL